MCVLRQSDKQVADSATDNLLMRNHFMTKWKKNQISFSWCIQNCFSAIIVKKTVISCLNNLIPSKWLLCKGIRCGIENLPVH